MANNYDEVVLTVADKQEIDRNKKGKKILLSSIILIVAGCASGMVILAPVAIVAFVYGVIKILHNRTEHQIRQDKALANATARTFIASAQAGKKIDLDNTAAARDAQQKKETKEIIKGAVVGSIVAGDAGAVVGATIAKNKIDNKKK